MKTTRSAASFISALGAVAALTPAAGADVQAWAAEVALGTASRYVDAAPVTNSDVDIGTYTGTTAATYEILVTAENHNGGAGPAIGGSTALIGVRNSGVGDQSGAKFEQWFSSGQYGVTQFGVADHFGAANQTGVDLHLTFVCDTVAGTTEIYENGVLVSTIPHAFVLEGMVGIGQVHDPNAGPGDVLSGTVYGVAVYDELLPVAEIITHSNAFFAPGNIGTNYCMAALNSTGVEGSILAMGSRTVANQNFTLMVEDLPNNSFGFFLTSLASGFVQQPGGSQGNLCLGGAIGRFVAPGQIMNTGGNGAFSLVVDLNAIPTPTGLVVIQAGETWYYQAWHRDAVGGSATSNFTDGLEVDFL